MHANEPCCITYPELHGQNLLPSEESEFAPHAMHSDEPSVENVLAGHKVHTSSDVVKPGRQRGQSETEEIPVIGANFFPAGHAWHVTFEAGHGLHEAAEDAPSSLKYFPLTHSTQPEAPSTMEYFPESHFLQVSEVEASGCVEYLPTSQAKHEEEPGFIE